ncbi:hypothetical protein FXF51_16940 [Nonomuraea sp. PA05]|nr:hypothetical protein FXF51_16940 [Nonomuraea sp. PA05]
MSAQAYAARLIVQALEAEGVEYIFGRPGEENIHFVDALRDSPIQYVLVRYRREDPPHAAGGAGGGAGSRCRLGAWWPTSAPPWDARTSSWPTPAR